MFYQYSLWALDTTGCRSCDGTRRVDGITRCVLSLKMKDNSVQTVEMWPAKKMTEDLPYGSRGFGVATRKNANASQQMEERARNIKRVVS